MSEDLLKLINGLRKETNEVLNAVALVGTKKRKLQSLIAMAQEIYEALSGDRPEVRQMKVELRRRMHDVAVSKTDQTAAVPLREMYKTLSDMVPSLVKGVGSAPLIFQVRDVEIGNLWGYTENEADSAIDSVRAVARRLEALEYKVADLTIVLDPQWFPGVSPVYAKYDPAWDTIAMDPQIAGSDKSVAEQVGRRIWNQNFDKNDKETWASEDEFAAKFAAAILRQGTFTPHMATRLGVTVGKWYPKWDTVGP